MSQFEYVSVAIALVYSFAVARIIAALPSVFSSERRDWIHALWSVVLLGAAAFTWWSIWNFRQVEWNALRFVWALSVPALIHVRAGILVSEEPRAVASWRDHFESIRVPFFSVGIAIMANLALLPWVTGSVPWFEPHGGAAGALLLSTLYALGIAFRQRAVQATIVVLNFVMMLGLLAT